LFFPGGDIGKLAVCGTVNDVAMMGAQPLYLTAGFMLEEGLDIEILQKVIASMKNSAQEAGVQIIAGDTKVLQKGSADALFINTSGIGIVRAGINVSGHLAKPGDLVILSGTIGDHGIAVLEARNELGFQTDVKSDIAPLNHLVIDMLSASNQIHVLRDPTRGGAATSLNEIARQSNVGILIYEERIPVKPAVTAACEMLGFDPIYVANEGKLIAIVAAEDANKVLTVMKRSTYGEDAVFIGEILAHPPERVLMQTTLGTKRVIDVLAGELLPRIC
jgi:hydrogenase expression/formation protein HypE